MGDVYNRPILKGTTTIGVVCKSGVVLASDTRVTMGYFVAHKRGKKIYKIDDHLAMTIAGGVADAQKAVEILKVNSKIYRMYHNRPFPVRAASTLLANVLFDSRPYPLLTQAIVGGIDDTGSR
ncbi:MAG: proteasome subunit beta, partial [Candidatus Bathyarchaeia archaeon]